MTTPFPRSAAEAPPQSLPGRGDVPGGLESVATADGGVGFSLQTSAWDTVAGMSQTLNDLADFLADLDDNPTLRAAANLRAMDRLRDALDRVPTDAGLRDPVVITVQDAALLARQLLTRYG